MGQNIATPITSMATPPISNQPAKLEIGLYAYYLSFNIPKGAQGLTLSVNHPDDVEVWFQASAGPAGLVLVLGNGAQSVTWNPRWATDGRLLISGLKESPNQQYITFSLKIRDGKDESVITWQPCYVACAGYLVAFDGTMSDQNIGRTGNTDIYRFFTSYPGSAKTYEKGVALLAITAANNAASRVQDAYQALVAFYTDTTLGAMRRKNVPIDIVGLSRGAFEASALINMLATSGIPGPGGASFKVGKDNATAGTDITLRFVGLVSPVIQMIGGTWPDTLPDCVQNTVEAFDANPDSTIFPQHEIVPAGGHYLGEGFDVLHQDIAWDPNVDNFLFGNARNDGVPVPAKAPAP
jgi:hypothetical protein